MSDFPPIPKDLFDTSSKEYVTWMAAVWKANDERNQNDKRLANIKEEQRMSEAIRKRILEDNGK